MKKSLKLTLVLYFVIFYIIWTISTLCLMPIIDLNLNEYLSTIAKTVILKNLVWTLPACVLIKKYHDNVEVPLIDMFKNKVNWIKYLPIFLIFTVYTLIGDYSQNGSIAISEDFKYTDLIIVLFVGLTEELVFRGWLLNCSIKDKKDDDLYIPIGVNAFLFLTIHFPRWIDDGVFITNFTNFGFISIMVLSAVFGYSFIKSKNILVPIFLHMYYDLLVFLLI